MFLKLHVLNSVQGQGTQIFTNKNATEKNKTDSLESSQLPYKPIYRYVDRKLILHVEKQSISRIGATKHQNFKYKHEQRKRLQVDGFVDGS